MATKTIKHGLFTYYIPNETVLADGTEGVQLVEAMAYHGQEVDIPRKQDIAKGEQHGAFYTDEELKELHSATEPVAQLDNPVDPENPNAITEGTTSFADLDDDDLGDWLTGTGRFDGKPKPTAPQVVAAAGEDAELAERLQTAEDRATGGEPRKTVIEGLQEIIDADEEEDED